MQTFPTRALMMMPTEAPAASPASSSSRPSSLAARRGALFTACPSAVLLLEQMRELRGEEHSHSCSAFAGSFLASSPVEGPAAHRRARRRAPAARSSALGRGGRVVAFTVRLTTFSHLTFPACKHQRLAAAQASELGHPAPAEAAAHATSRDSHSFVSAEHLASSSSLTNRSAPSTNRTTHKRTTHRSGCSTPPGATRTARWR